MPEKGVYSRQFALKILEISAFFALTDGNLHPFQVLRSFEVVTFLINK